MCSHGRKIPNRIDDESGTSAPSTATAPLPNSNQRRQNTALFNTELEYDITDGDDDEPNYSISNSISPDDQQVDVAIVGAGIGGLCAGAILNTLYGKKVGIFESHYLPGGCAHAFSRKAKLKDGTVMEFTFDSGPTILLGCSQRPYNALRQVLDAVGQSVTWIRYDGWGMIEWPLRPDREKRWKCELGPDVFQRGPLLEFGGPEAVQEFEELRAVTKDLVVGSGIPAMAMRPGPSALIPLVKYFPTLVRLLQQGEALTGTFEAYMDGPKFVVKNKWLRDWLDALAFSLSGLPASRTAAAAMAFVLDDMHRSGAALDYPEGGLGEVITALVRAVEQGDNQSRVHLRSHVTSIDFTPDGSKAIGLTLKNGQTILAREGVICNAPIWTLRNLIDNKEALRKLSNDEGLQQSTSSKQQPKQTWIGGNDGYSISLRRVEHHYAESQPRDDLLEICDTAEMTGSFLHLHIAIDARGLDLDSMEAHYTVMDRGLSGDETVSVNGVPDGPCGELNMIAVSNPCVIDKTLAPDGYMIIHAYGAGNEPYGLWGDMKRNTAEYKKLKEERSEALWRAIESVIPDVRRRVVLDLVGSPLTHERFLRRPMGTYGSATEDYLKDGSTPIPNFVLAGDQVFPGIGVPAVAISGASAANAMVNPVRQWFCLDSLTGLGRI
ncbi:phytoene dehydrogenase-like oxidoreductase [Nitzschia inconspicua]|uniref:Phytoene dehydrogenase-like oxidoreductase n=1 Tax=Nitzschia inconspicua TaxID=303405 RepID=A0A9K3KHK2_9STRA|nr:phytoene dehydrogenase-like oxidoreductase [Nitzschia inconspicua]